MSPNLKTPTPRAPIFKGVENEAAIREEPGNAGLASKENAVIVSLTFAKPPILLNSDHSSESVVEALPIEADLAPMVVEALWAVVFSTNSNNSNETIEILITPTFRI